MERHRRVHRSHGVRTQGLEERPVGGVLFGAARHTCARYCASPPRGMSLARPRCSRVAGRRDLRLADVEGRRLGQPVHLHLLEERRVRCRRPASARDTLIDLLLRRAEALLHLLAAAPAQWVRPPRPHKDKDTTAERSVARTARHADDQRCRLRRGRASCVAPCVCGRRCWR